MSVKMLIEQLRCARLIQLSQVNKCGKPNMHWWLGAVRTETAV